MCVYMPTYRHDFTSVPDTDTHTFRASHSLDARAQTYVNEFIDFPNCLPNARRSLAL